MAVRHYSLGIPHLSNRSKIKQFLLDVPEVRLYSGILGTKAVAYSVCQGIKVLASTSTLMFHIFIYYNGQSI